MRLKGDAKGVRCIGLRRRQAEIYTVLGPSKPFKIKLIPCIFVDSVHQFVTFVRLRSTAKFTAKV